MYIVPPQWHPREPRGPNPLALPTTLGTTPPHSCQAGRPECQKWGSEASGTVTRPSPPSFSPLPFILNFTLPSPSLDPLPLLLHSDSPLPFLHSLLFILTFTLPISPFPSSFSLSLPSIPSPSPLYSKLHPPVRLPSPSSLPPFNFTLPSHNSYSPLRSPPPLFPPLLLLRLKGRKRGRARGGRSGARGEGETKGGRLG